MRRWREYALTLLLLWMTWWLLEAANSATSMIGLTGGTVVMLFIGLPFVSRRLVGTYLIVGVLVVAGLQIAFDLYTELLELVGRDATLTDRTELWSDALALQPNAWLGAGFESFWLGPRLDHLWERWWWHPNQAHNGYIETYLNQGVLGSFLLLGALVSAFRTISASLRADFDFAQFRLAMLLAILAFNFTEASFKAVHFIWTMFYVVAIDCPRGFRSREDVSLLDSARANSQAVFR